MATCTVPGVAAPARASPVMEQPPVLSLADYLAAVADVVRAGMPSRSWIEAAVTAVKANSYGHGISLVDPSGGPSAPTLRAFLRASDRAVIADRLEAALDPIHLVGMTVVVQIEPEFHPRWGMGGRITGLSAALRESLLRRVLEEVRARLKAEKLYDRQRGLPRPADVARVAVVHPAGAAGHADIAGELARWEKSGIVEVASVPAPFEGPRAVAEIVEALRRAVSGDLSPDVVLMVRGGGDRAGLLALDDETVARAVCTCPVPVIAGLGHAVDRSLVDEVAWTSCDTPSKALTHLAALIVGPARRARADLVAVMAEADRRSATALHGLDAVRQSALVAAERRLTAGEASLAAARAGVEAGAVGGAERCRRLGDEAARALRAVLDRAPHHLAEVGRGAGRLTDDAMAAARRRLERADDGRTLIGAVLSQAGARLDAAALDALRQHEAVPVVAARRLTDAAGDLAGLARTVEALGLDATLKRGFALATRRDGTLVPTRAAALAAGVVTLTFADGPVAARIGTALTTPSGEAA